MVCPEEMQLRTQALYDFGMQHDDVKPAPEELQQMHEFLASPEGRAWHLFFLQVTHTHKNQLQQPHISHALANLFLSGRYSVVGLRRAFGIADVTEDLCILFSSAL